MKRFALNGTALLVSILLAAGAAAFGGMYGPGEWYRGLAKPEWNPPNWVFGPVWSFLYLSMAVAAWLVWLRRDRHRTVLPLGLYGTQLVLNALWSWLFFGLHRMGLAFAEIVLLDGLIIACAVAFWPVHRVSSLLMIPYAAWVSFAAFLNLTLWRMNG